MKIVKFINSLLPKRIQGNDGLIQGLLAAAGPALWNIGSNVAKTAATGGIMKGLSSLFGGDSETPQAGYDVVTMPQYSFTEPMLRQTSDYLTDAMSRLSRGEYPSYYENALPTLRKRMSDPLYQTYYGRPGERTGIVNDAFTMGSISGVGPKASMAQGRKAMQDYATQESAIDEYLTGLGVDLMNQQSQYLPNAVMNMPQGPNAQIVSWGGGEAQPSFMSQLASSFPWENIWGSKSPTTKTSIPAPGSLKNLAYNIEDYVSGKPKISLF